MKETLLSVCITAIMTGIYKALAPADKFGAQIKLLVSCFFAVTVMNTVSGVPGLWDLSSALDIDTGYADYTVQVRKLTAEETADNLRGIISRELAEEGITPEKIYIDVNISDSGSISISEIKLVFGSAGYDENAGRAVVLVRQITGTKIKVTAELTPQAKKERERQ